MPQNIRIYIQKRFATTILLIFKVSFLVKCLHIEYFVVNCSLENFQPFIANKVLLRNKWQCQIFAKISKVKKSVTIVSYRETTTCIMSSFASIYMPSGWLSWYALISASKVDFSVFLHKIRGISSQKQIQHVDLRTLVL